MATSLTNLISQVEKVGTRVRGQSSCSSPLYSNRVGLSPARTNLLNLISERGQ